MPRPVPGGLALFVIRLGDKSVDGVRQAIHNTLSKDAAIPRKSRVKVMTGSQKYKCKVCGAIHGGVKSPNVCADCYAKGERRRYFRPALGTITFILMTAIGQEQPGTHHLFA